MFSLLYFENVMMIVNHRLHYAALLDRDADENKCSVYGAVVKEALRKKEKSGASRRERGQGADSFPALHVSVRCCVYTWSSHLLECWILCGRLLSLLAKSTHATWQMFSVADPNTPHLFWCLSSEHVRRRR